MRWARRLRRNCDVRARMRSSTSCAGVSRCRSLAAARYSLRERNRARRNSRQRCVLPGYTRAVVARCSRFGRSMTRASSTTVAEFDRFDIAICVSGHAVRLALDRIDTHWTRRPEVIWIAVGEATASALSGAEFGAAAGDRVVGGYTRARAAQPSSRAPRADLCRSRWTSVAGGRIVAARCASDVADSV